MVVVVVGRRGLFEVGDVLGAEIFDEGLGV